MEPDSSNYPTVSGELVQEIVKCKHAIRYRLNSIYCTRIDGWVSVNYCNNMCRFKG